MEEDQTPVRNTVISKDCESTARSRLRRVISPTDKFLAAVALVDGGALSLLLRHDSIPAKLVGGSLMVAGGTTVGHLRLRRYRSHSEIHAAAVSHSSAARREGE